MRSLSVGRNRAATAAQVMAHILPALTEHSKIGAVRITVMIEQNV